MPKQIQMPSFLASLVATSPYNYVVLQAIQHFSQWYKDSTLPFFPDYTNHGVDHLEEVMTTAEVLITTEARMHFSDADAVALVLSVLLHDSALHLSKAGFWELIKGSYQANHIPAFDKQDWQRTWDDFFFFARRWDDAKLMDVFGSNQEGGPKAQVRDPFGHWDDLGEADRLLIGEFIRQQHPRIAHEMAVYGIPGNLGEAFKLNPGLPAEWRNMVGLIARSHGLPLRPCVDYLGKEFGHVAKREYQSVHAVYLMALLRIADYVQIQPSRTSTLVFAYKSISSRVSELEHKVHQAVRNITDKGDDPESLHIDAHPAEVAVFLRLKEWLAGIQSELDASWAVLGEVYGLQQDLRNLGLLFRRVRSNLDDVADFATRVSYVPDRIRFDVARAELLKLLIGPLYGDDPSYGVRELMQNSIDAVREYEQFVLDHPEYADVPRREQEADVVIELSALDETGHAVMTISDRGIGMKEEVIRDYFLRAGASYRQSSQWKATFETDEAEGPKSKVLRSGRFGVGALAAFLIGKDIVVETRHAQDDYGYIFKTNLENASIEIKKENKNGIGTAILINVDENSYYQLIKNTNTTTKPKMWDWYWLPKPTLIRKYTQDRKESILPNTHANVSNANINWRKLRIDLPYSVYWTFDESPALICNGIFVTDSRKLTKASNRSLSKNNSFVFYNGLIRIPNISILDADNEFPINLQRNGLSHSSYPFEKEVIEDVLTEMISWLFFNGPDSITSRKLVSTSLKKWTGGGVSMGLVGSFKGYGLKIKSLLQGYKISHTMSHTGRYRIKNVSPETLIFKLNSPGIYNELYNDSFTDISIQTGIQTKLKWNYEQRLLFNDKTYANLNFDNSSKIEGFSNHSAYSKVYVAEKKEDEISYIRTEKCPKVLFEIEISKEEGILKKGLFLTESFYPEGYYMHFKSQEWLIDDLWRRYFGTNWIPYSIEERIKLFPKTALFLLERYPQTIEKNNMKSVKAMVEQFK